MTEIKCNGCGAIYMVKNVAPKNMKCLCSSRDFKKCRCGGK